MNPVLDTIKARRSIRAFRDTPIAQEDLQAVLEAGSYAPAGLTMGNRRFTALAGPAQLQQANGAIRDALLSIPVTPDTHPYVQSLIDKAQAPDADFLYHAPCFVIVSAQQDNPSGMADCAVAIQNMLLAAQSLGLGSCWLNQLPGLVHLPEIQALMRRLDIPEDHTIYGSFSLGYAAAAVAESAPARGRSSIHILR